VVQVAARTEFADIQAFRRAILALPLEFSLDGTATVRFRSLRGKTLEFTYGKPPLDYSRWPLFGGPFLEAAKDSQVLVMKYHNLRRTLDFRTLTITDGQ
jgi:hypothetical protein